MPKSARMRAEKLFSARSSKDEELLDDKKRAQKERAAKVARLRGLRQAKEFADAARKETRDNARTARRVPEPSPE